jgi:K+-sensing histidine kinase KdpD
LKNPLNILQNIQYYNSYNEQLDVVKQTSNLMMNLVQDILDVNKYENTKMNLEIINLSILHLVDIAHKDVLYLLENKNIIIEKKIQNNIGVKSDKNILVRVITNLLTNAIKYAPQNSIITIEANESIENKDFVEILIADQGKGIPQEYLEKIFDKFIQINKKDEKVRSTGLGLTFCKLAIESHNGTIKAESKEGTGAKFIFTVPKTTEYEVYNDLKFESEKTAFIFNNEEISYLKNYIEQLKNSAVYKISNINTILKMIKENSNSSNIILWCDNLYKTAISGNQKKYKEILNI